MNVSVLMTTYNGESFIKEQLDSVVKQLEKTDELIISDDGSTDNTIKIIKEYLRENIKLFDGPHNGVIKNFEYAFSKSSNNVILFCDQDDIWNENKIKTIKDRFKKEPTIGVIMHDANIMHDIPGDSDNTIFRNRKARHGILKNVVASSYYGCCMAITRDYMLKIMPFPPNTLSYDQYIGNCAEIDKTTMFISDKLIYHREHANNWSKKQDIFSRLGIRMNYIEGIFSYKSGINKKESNLF